jgi:hemoglobin-like flavoprotein
MGSIVSKKFTRRSLDAIPTATEPLVVEFPSYFREPLPNSDDIKRIRHSWQLIIEDNGVEYQAQKSVVPYSSCWAWFYNSFYERLFQVAPETRPLFKNDIAAQGKSLVGMISVMIGLFNNMHMHSATEKSTLDGLAKRHVGYGVDCKHYGVFGEVLFWTLKKVLGSECSDEVQTSWLTMYCYMLKIVIPAATREANRQRLEGKRRHSH